MLTYVQVRVQKFCNFLESALQSFRADLILTASIPIFHKTRCAESASACPESIARHGDTVKHVFEGMARIDTAGTAMSR
jgi:hypothetical protein